MVEFGRLELEAEHVNEELPEVVDGGGVLGQEGGDEIVDVMAGGGRRRTLATIAVTVCAGRQ